jgi:hypothetical protein
MSGLVPITKKVPDEILKTIQCSLSHKLHISNDPILLGCGHIACRQCVLHQKNHELTCCICNKKHTISNPDSLVTVRTAEILIESYTKELFRMVENDFASIVDLFEGLSLVFIISMHLSFNRFLPNRILCFSSQHGS